MIKNLIVFDFDSTLFNTPQEKEGKKMWEKSTNKKFPHTGWWSKPESLDINIFDIKPIESILKILKREVNNDKSYVVILTARIEKLRPEVEMILKNNNIVVDQVILKKGGETKGEVILKLIKDFDNIENIVVYDDMQNKERKIKEFTSIRDKIPENINYTINKVNPKNGNFTVVECKQNIKNIIQEEIKKILNEVSFHDLQYDQIITPEYIKEVENSDNYERFIELYKMENNLMDVDDSEIEESEDFKNWFKYELEYRYDDVVDKIYGKIKQNGYIDIWREMTVDDKWINDLIKTGKHLGIYWSWDENAAEAHWGYGSSNKHVTIKSSVNEKHVNWIETIHLNMDYSLEEEKEIRLFKNTPLKIEELEYDGKDLMETSLGQKIKNKTFYA